MIETRFVSLVDWLIDVYLLSTVLLVVGLAVMSRYTQPSRRMAVARSTAAGLAALALIATAPSWPRMAAIRWEPAEPAAVPHAAIQTAVIEAPSARSVQSNAADVTMDSPVDATAVAPLDRPLVPRPIKANAARSLPSWRSILAIAFMIGAMMNVAWLALGAVEAFRLRRSARVASGCLQRLMMRAAGDRYQEAHLCLSDSLSLPVAVGVMRPVIVLPSVFAESQRDDQLEAALAHEWAHIQNGDLRWLALLRLLNSVLYAQPLYWWLRRAIRADQEALADAAAASIDGDNRVAYAEALLGWARSTQRPHPGVLASAALALWERPSMLRRRVCLLLDQDHRVEQSTSRRWKLTTACIGVTAALLLSMVTLRPSAATPREIKGSEAKMTPARPNSEKTAQADERFEYAGRVLDPDGKPVAGAKLHLAYFGYQGQAPPAIRAASDSAGRFRIEMRKSDFVDSSYETPWTTAQVVATAMGFGLGWTDASRQEDTNIDPHNLTIRLARDGGPVSGRVVDLEGRPVAGAIIRHEEILEPAQGDLSGWIAASTAGADGSYELERQYLKRKLWPRASGLPVAITTDSQGQFSIVGAGQERLIRLKVSGETVQSKEFSVLTRAIAPFRVNHGRGSTDWGIAQYYGTSFTHAAAPTKPVIGIVIDKETRKPLAGVRIECHKTADFPVHGFKGIVGTTDAQGRFRLVGLPKGRGNQVIVIPAKGQPYLAAGIEVPDTPGLDPVVLDVGLKRGVVIEGRVTDKISGKPVKAFVQYQAFTDNPALADVPEFKTAAVWGQYQTEPDGSFRVVGLPGRGLIAAMAIEGGTRYLKGVGLAKVVSPGEGLPVVPGGNLWDFNVLSEVNPSGQATTFRRDLPLESGLNRTVRVVDPEGRPIAGARFKFEPFLSWLTPPQQKAETVVEALRSDEVRPVLAFHDGNKLAGAVEVRGDNPAAVELKLRPWGNLVGRLVDQDGSARPNVHLEYLDRPGTTVITDSQGRFRMEGLVPGRPAEVWVSATTGYLSGKIAENLVLGPGETRDTGDVREKR